jgi:hypothetical protein
MSDERYTRTDEDEWYDSEKDDYISSEAKEDRVWGESYMNEMADVNPGWVSGEESD